MSEMYIPRAIPFNAPCFTGLNHSEIADFVGDNNRLHTETNNDVERFFLSQGINIYSEIHVGDFLVKNHDGSISVHNPESFYSLYQEYTNV